MAENGCADADVKTSSPLWPSNEAEHRDNQWLLREPRKSGTLVLWLTLSASLILHLLILQFRLPPSAQPSASAKPAASTIVLHLKQQRKNPLPTDDVAQNKQEQNSVSTQEILPTETVSHDVVTEPLALDASSIAADKVPASAEDIKRVIQASHYQGAVVLTLEEKNFPDPIATNADAAFKEAQSQTSNQSTGDQAFSDVFDPRLRRRLQNNVTRVASVKAQGLSETINIHGDSEVRLGDGRCMEAKADHRIGEAKDWLITACSGGTNDEGELILQRVNDSLRGR